MNENISKEADNESTVEALEGLLKMGSSKVDSSGNLAGSQFQPSPIISQSLPSAQAFHSAALSILMNPMQSQQSSPWQANFQQNQLNGVSTAVASASGSPQMTSQVSTVPTFSLPLFAPHASLQLGHVPNPLPNNDTVQTSVSVPLQPIAPKKKESKDLTIRKSEVEAALKSKPQRGRKRDNLNGMERLELTRTRNREHAKSTRIRKKARYEELVANEEKYFRFVEKEKAQECMNKNFIKFMEARTVFLKMKLGEYAAKNWDFSLEAESEHDKSSCSSKNNISQEMLTLYEPVIENLSSFAFQAQSGKPTTQHSGFQYLQLYDTDIVNQVKAKVQNTANISFNFSIKDEIALNSNNIGFADFELQLSHGDATERQVKTISSGIIQAQFAKNGSSKLSSIRHIVTSSYLDSLGPDSGASLGSATAFPSVVSLDHHLHST